MRLKTTGKKALRVGFSLVLLTPLLGIVSFMNKSVHAVPGFQYIRAVPQGESQPRIGIGYECTGANNSTCQAYYYASGNPSESIINDTPPYVSFLRDCAPGVSCSPSEFRITANGTDFDWTKGAQVLQGNPGQSVTIADPSNLMSQFEADVTPSLPTDSPQSTAPGAGQDTSAEGNPDEANGVEDSCENTGGILSWALCPVLRILELGISQLDRAINGLLFYNFDKATDGGEIKTAWQRIRNLAYIILIPIMLVMIISTALGFNFVDAYTIKKALPRLLFAIIFIALSWDVCRIIVDLVNTVGRGAAGLIGGTVGTGGISEMQIDDVFGVGESIFTTLFTGGTIVAAFAFTEAALGILGFVAFILFSGLLVTLLVLALRQVIITALILLAPLAILAWIFPGNDKLWKTWWNSFTKLLLLYPIIIILITTGKVFAYIVANSGDGFLNNPILDFILKTVAYIGPYFFIPATFKMAGGMFANLAGIANDRSRGIFDRQRKKRQHSMDQGLERSGRKVLQWRADKADNLKSRADKSGRLGALLNRTGSRLIGGYNIEADMSEKRENVGKEINSQIATGRDEEIRAITAIGSYQAWRNAKTDTERQKLIDDGIVQKQDDGTVKFRTLGGAYSTEANIKAGMNRWGDDTFAQQAALSYEMRKASTEEELQGLAKNYKATAKAWGMSDNQTKGAWVGAAFENQNQHLEFKNMSGGTQMTSEGYEKFSSEIFEKRGSYQMSQMGSNTIVELKNAYHSAQAVIAKSQSNPGSVSQADVARAERTISNVRGAAETFMYRGGVGGQQLGTVDDKQVMDPAALAKAQATGGAGGILQTNTPGAGHVAERVRELAVEVGVFQHLDPSTYTDSTTTPGTAGGDQIPRQGA